MKVGIVGVGAVGTACAKSMLLRGSCHELVLVDTNIARAKGVATDLRHGALLCPPAVVRHGALADLAGCSVVAITAGLNEKSGQAIDRADKLGRLRLLPHNAMVYGAIIPEFAAIAPEAVLLVVTDPPDPLADVALDLVQRAGSRNPVISAGTYLDTVRFQLQISQRLRCHPASVNALVIGEHGTSQVYVWSAARIGGRAVLDHVREAGTDPQAFRAEVEAAVRHANIDIIEGTGASQHGIGIVTARIVEAILRDEGLIAPVGVRHPQHGVTVSLPCVIGQGGVQQVLAPQLTNEEEQLLAASAAAIRAALAWLAQPGAPPATPS